MRVLILLMLFISCHSFAQDQQGYYVTNNSQRVEGYFKTTDFFDSTSLEFKTDNGGSYTRLSPESITEYGIGSAYKFVKHRVQIDKSDNNDSKMYSNTRDPQFVTEELFLNVLLEGQYASLYSVNVNKSTRYFYTLEDNSKFSQLVYKKYTLDGTVILYNRLYQGQIYSDLNCNAPADKFKLLQYSKDELIKVFTDFNICKGSTPVIYSNRGSRMIKFAYTIFGGAYSNTLLLKGGRFPEVSKASLSYGIGGELALQLPSGTWELFIRGEFEIFDQEAKSSNYHTSFNDQQVVTTIKGTAVNGYLGPRYNVVLNDKNKLFFDAAIGLNFFSADLNMKMISTPFGSPAYVSHDDTYSLGNTTCFNLGAGYLFNNKFGVRVAFETMRKVADVTNLGYSTSITRLGLNLRYTLN